MDGGSNLRAVVTTIQPPTESLRRLVASLVGVGAGLTIVGDVTTPDYATEELEPRDAWDYLSLDDQLEGPFGELARLLPTRHYARKNLGYLHAIAGGAERVYETDDDNRPAAGWSLRDELVEDCRVIPSGADRWVNVYRYFSDERVWPRGLPLDGIDADVPAAETAPLSIRSPIQQGLVNGSADVDAIWRLVLDRAITFDPDARSVALMPGNWSPFNTQSTWWWPRAFPLLYVPSHCSFRMTDIWRSFVAQRCLWAAGLGVVFHTAEVVQDRNPHDLVADLELELPGYRENRRIAKALAATDLEGAAGSMPDDLLRCYAALVGIDVFPAEELTLARTWLDALERARP